MDGRGPIDLRTPDAIRHARLLRIPEVAEMLSLSRSKVYQLIDSGVLPVVKIGRSTRVEAGRLRTFIDECASAPRRPE